MTYEELEKNPEKLRKTLHMWIDKASDKDIVVIFMGCTLWFGAEKVGQLNKSVCDGK